MLHILINIHKISTGIYSNVLIVVVSWVAMHIDYALSIYSNPSVMCNCTFKKQYSNLTSSGVIYSNAHLLCSMWDMELQIDEHVFKSTQDEL